MLIGLAPGTGLGVAAHLTLGDQPILDGLIRYGSRPVGEA
jgi:hypothetical protein